MVVHLNKGEAMLKSDLFALLLVTIVAGFVLYDSRRLKSPVYAIMKIVCVFIVLLWVMAALVLNA
jgi:hypothetical protein